MNEENIDQDGVSMGIVDAHPTKDFFIQMLTRDISLDRAILDLIDNSIDAAYSNRNEDLSRCEIRISISNSNFEITDNCGGMPLKVAKDYAFRFGRPEEHDGDVGSIGQFGVGLKRTLLKMGKRFSLVSHCDSSFEVKCNVSEWRANEEWSFEIDQDLESQDSKGVTIKVTELYEEVVGEFTLETFLNGLSESISKAHFQALSEGVKIFVNGFSVPQYNIQLKSSEKLSPIYTKQIVDGVSVECISGVSDRDINKGGWSVICNRRLVLYADTSNLTGWAVDGVPKYHANFAFFRGVVIFSSEDSSNLPWTTTKTGVDHGHKIYKFALNEMKKQMRKWTVFLRDRANEESQFKDQIIENRQIGDAISTADVVNFSEIRESVGVFPEKTTKIIPKSDITVQYKVRISDADKVKAKLGVSSATQMGLETFQYYLDYECSDE